MKSRILAMVTCLAITASAGMCYAEEPQGMKAQLPPEETPAVKAMQAQQMQAQENMVRLQHDIREQAEKRAKRQEELLDQGEKDQKRFEKIMDKWEAQQDQYQKYLDKLTQSQGKESR